MLDTSPLEHGILEQNMFEDPGVKDMPNDSIVLGRYNGSWLDLAERFVRLHVQVPAQLSFGIDTCFSQGIIKVLTRPLTGLELMGQRRELQTPLQASLTQTLTASGPSSRSQTHVARVCGQFPSSFRPSRLI